MRTYAKQQINRLIALETILGGGSSGPILSIGVTAPITTTGGDTPTIGITPATDLAAGSLSASDKTKLDNLSGAGTVVRINNSNSPYQALHATFNVIADVSTGNAGNANTIIHPPLNPADNDPFSVKVNLGDSSAAPILIEPVAGQPAIEDPSQPGTFRTNVATFASIKSGPGGYATWRYNLALNQWLLYGVI
jgi:hypothetical protein